MVIAFTLVFSGAALAKVTITFGTWAGKGAGTWQLLEAYVNGFNASQDEIEVQLVTVASYDQKIPVLLASGLGDDILHIHQNNGYAWREGLVNLAPYLQQSKINPLEYVPGVFDSSNYAGRMPWIPDGLQPQMLFYNTYMLANAGLDNPVNLHAKQAWNWEAFVTYAKKLTVDADGNGTPEQWGAAGFLNRNLFITRQNGGSVVSPDGTRYTGNAPEYVEAIQWLADLYYVHRVVPNTTDSITAALNRLRNRTAAIGHYSPNGRTNVRASLQPGEWDVAPFFERVPGRPWTHLSGNGFGININSKHKEEAWKFIEFVISLQGQLINAAVRADLPIHLRAIASPEYLKEEGTRNMDYVIRRLPEQFAIFTPKYIPDDGEINRLNNAAINSVFKGEKPAAVAFDEIANTVQGILDRLQGQIIIK
ncbi:MAG TPA: extracellular solute-binding protein [Firmicutes bacterium]|nr:extracellular solute-binding protein [Bacillota bacterium]